PPTAGFFQELSTSECYFLNGTERVRFLERYIYNREQWVHFDSDVGIYVADTPMGENDVKDWNSDPDLLEYQRGIVDTYCRYNYDGWTDITERR
ncbi:HB2L protein, partial [Bucco capensis]|nr:HB2L protein [Bucco capensis]